MNAIASGSPSAAGEGNAQGSFPDVHKAQLPAYASEQSQSQSQPRARTELLHYVLTNGESIGDLDLLYASERRWFTVRALKNSTVLELSQEKFRKFCVSNPDALLLFLRLAVGRWLSL